LLHYFFLFIELYLLHAISDMSRILWYQEAFSLCDPKLIEVHFPPPFLIELFIFICFYFSMLPGTYPLTLADICVYSAYRQCPNPPNRHGVVLFYAS